MKVPPSNSFGPDRLKALAKAFDDAWEKIAPGVGTNPQTVETARNNLADVILGLSNEGVEDTAQLAEAALKSLTTI